MRKSSKNLITLFFITLFLIFKVTGLHALSHYDNDLNIDHCEICEISTIISFTPLLESETTVLHNAEYFFVKQKQNDKAFFIIYNNEYLFGYRFTRPPPKLI